MEIEDTAIPGVKILTPRRFGDHRGFFAETYSKKVLQEGGIDVDFVQDNHSLSMTPGTVRGLHFQAPPHEQGKLVRCGRGALYDVAVDIRTGSPTYGQWVGAELTADNGRQLWVPAGMAHGFLTLVPETEIVYKCTGYYNQPSEGALVWNDPDIGIDWPMPAGAEAVLSEKDAVAPGLAGYQSPFTWEG